MNILRFVYLHDVAICSVYNITACSVTLLHRVCHLRFVALSVAGISKLDVCRDGSIACKCKEK